MNKKLSIILPVYEVQLYIEECLNSILKIQKIEFEIIIVDDGSTDHSMTIIENKFQKPNIKIIKQKNKGLSSARNTGLKHAAGDYIWFVDSDDIIVPEGIEKLVENIHDEDIIIGNYYKLCENKSCNLNNTFEDDSLRISGKEALEKYYLKKINTIVWRCIYKKSFLLKNNLIFFEGITYEDVQWTPRILFFATEVLLTNIPIYIYRIRDNSIVTSGFSTKKCNDIILVSDSLDIFKNDYNLSPKQKQIIDKSTSYFLLLAYHKAKKAKIDFEFEEIFKRIKQKQNKGILYRGIMLIKKINKNIFNTILSYKFRNI